MTPRASSIPTPAWRTTTILATLLVAGTMVQGPVHAQSLPDTPWDAVAPEQAQVILALLADHLALVPAEAQQAWEDVVGVSFESIPDLAVQVYALAQNQLVEVQSPTERQALEAVQAAVAILAQDFTGLLFPPNSTESPRSQCVVTPQGGVLAVLCPVYIVLGIVILPVAIALTIALRATSGTLAQLDAQADGIGDEWQDYWESQLQNIMAAADDSDSDGLSNVNEFRWELHPACVGGLGGAVILESFQLPVPDVPPTPEQRVPTGRVSPLCRDFDQDELEDGPEWTYWNNPSNDALLIASVPHPSNGGTLTGTALFDPDRTLDSDGDTIRNAYDADSDNDTLRDGAEMAAGTYPEFQDSDCGLHATSCTPSSQTSYYAVRAGGPGEGDGMGDAAELEGWDALGADLRDADHDSDGISNNLLDPDADGDTLLDGEEFLVWATKPHLLDSDLDGLDDGDEVRAYRTDPAEWDSDGDAMPDGWEAQGNLNPLVDDAGLDPDADGLVSLGEYTYARPGGWSEATQGPWMGGTNPSDMDTEGDALTDGEEVLGYSTDPHHWDTDADGMADFFEASYGFDPLSPSDASVDADADSFDQGNDGSIQMAWPNLEEYRYGRSSVPGWDEVAMGAWRSGTDPTNPDTDGDGAKDGQEAYFGTDARVPTSLASDDDGDGLTWDEEANMGTNPSDADSDGDGLCDGSRGANCRFPGLGSTGNMPGEADYGSIAWETDSDADGLPDGQEAPMWDPGASGSGQDVDGDLLNGVIDNDADNDGLSDGVEFGWTQPAVPDSDGDGLLDGDEVQHRGTNPMSADSDSDQLIDGEEVEVHHTRPAVWDTDGDGLGDGAEANTHGTDPLLPDSDQDALPDMWEVTYGTQARVPDADQDPDADALSNARELAIESLPLWADSDGTGVPPGDGLPDGYEDQYGLGATVYNPSDDADGDGYSNLNEYNAKTHPLVADTDGDGADDGWEGLTAGTDPLDADTDKDGLGDGAEHAAWTAKGYAWNADHDSDTLKALRDPDSDNDGLSDRDELVDAQTKPHVRDSDGDGLSDFDEVVAYGGQYDPNDADTDNDGQGDGVEVALADTNGDFDRDGLKNGDEGSYGTDPTKEDTDCDGARDGPEYNYWSGLGYGTGNLLVADADGDGVKDGIEIGTAGTPSQALYKTRPDLADTDGDGIQDGSEARNNVKVTCGGAQTQSTQLSPIPMLIPQSGPSVLAGLTKTLEGFYVGHDEQGWYVQGGYGVRLYVNESLSVTATVQEVVEALGMHAQSSGGSGVPGSNGQCTDPTFRDTDGDGVSDFEEQYGTSNPYKGQKHDANGPGGNTNPCSPHSDQDGIPDGAELGVGVSYAWVMNPNSVDTDGDGRTDDVEDSDRDGASDLSFDGFTGVNSQNNAGSAPIETSPIDADTDDDGIPDVTDDKPLDWDRDHDGLSDGLESGITDRVKVGGSYVNSLGIDHTVVGKNVFGLDWPTYQEFPTAQESPASYGGGAVAITTQVGVADSDGDGILDGLEDLNHNGIFGDLTESRPNVGDTDGDGLTDGRELLVYGTYTFQSFVQARGDPAAAMAYDDALFKTNPLLNSTDTDSVLDGKDINPKGDGVMLLQLDTFYQYDEIDIFGNNHETDLVLKLRLETGVGDFAVSTVKLQDFGRKNGADFAAEALELTAKQNPPTITGAALAAIDLATDASDTIQFDLPENIDDFARSRDLKVRVRVDAIDIDGEANANEMVDISKIAGDTQYFDANGVDLIAGPLSGGHRVLLNDANGNADNIRGDNNDGQLLMNLGSNLVPYFLRNILGTQFLSGNCLAGVDELSRPCIQ